MVVMRSRFSWASWRRSRATRRLSREEQRLRLLLALVTEQQEKVASLRPLVTVQPRRAGKATRQAELAKERLQERETPEHELRRKDHDLEL